MRKRLGKKLQGQSVAYRVLKNTKTVPRKRTNIRKRHNRRVLRIQRLLLRRQLADN